MPNCPQCGTLHEPEDRYCPRCGNRIVGKSTDQPMSTMKAMNISDVQYKLGMVYFKKGDYLRAAETWEKVLQGRPENATLLKTMIEDARSRHEAEGAS